MYRIVDKGMDLDGHGGVYSEVVRTEINVEGRRGREREDYWCVRGRCGRSGQVVVWDKGD